MGMTLGVLVLYSEGGRNAMPSDLDSQSSSSSSLDGAK